MCLHGANKIKGDECCWDGMQGPVAIPQQIAHELQVHLSPDGHCKAMVGSWGVASGSAGASKDLAQVLCLIVHQEAELIKQ